ncbi:MAG: TRAP transporter small permease [Firmicutes bacterium]|nr:TRAP transporter small permease [Bacillota bacterium]
MEGFDKFVRKLTWRTAQIGQITLAAVMFLIVLNVLLRMLWNKPVPGTVELTEMLGAVLLAMGVAHCQVTKGHIFVDVLVQKFSPQMQRAVDALMSTLALFFTVLLARETLVFGVEMARKNYKTADLLLPVFPVICLVGLGFLMLALVILLDLVKAIIINPKGREVQ